MNRISMIATTWCPDNESGELRLATFIRALKSWNKNLCFDGAIDLIVADDGTADDLWHRMIAVESLWKRGLFQVSQARKRGVGGSLNRGWRGLNTPIVLYAVDDWALSQPFDLNPWVQLLEERNDVGVVRLGPPHPGNVLRVAAWTGNRQGWAGELLPESWSVIVSERPALWHWRMVHAHGLFKEECSALECEADYDRRYRASMAGPQAMKVLLALPTPWEHLDSMTLSEVEPRDRP